MRKLISLAAFMLFVALGNAQELLINTSFEPEDNFPGGTADARYDVTAPFTDDLGVKWIPGGQLQNWKFAEGSPFLKTGRYSLWLKNSSSITIEPDVTKGAGILTFWHKKVSMHGEAFILKVEYSTDGGANWQEAHNKAFQASDEMIWEKVEVQLMTEGATHIRMSCDGANTNDKGLLIEDLSLTEFDSSQPMTYESSTFMHDATLLDATQNQIIGVLKVTTPGVSNPVTLDKMTVNLNGTKNIDDISGINIYYTGTSEEFSTSNRFGAENIAPAGNNIEITGSQVLSTGINYFYVTFNLKEQTLIGSQFDAECVSVTINGEDKTPEVTAPEGRKDYMLPEKPNYSPYYFHRFDLFDQLPDTPDEVFFLGNSISDGCEWGELFGDLRFKNRGISGDVTDGILYRLHQITNCKPKQVFLMIGVNDLAGGRTPQYIIENHLKIYDRIEAESPSTEIIVQSLLPVNNVYGLFTTHTNKGQFILEINEELRQICEQRGYTFVDLFSKMVNGEGKLRKDLSEDGLHINGLGYLIWKQEIESLINQGVSTPSGSIDASNYKTSDNGGSGISVYPNPTSGIVNLSSDAKVEVYDNSGMHVLNLENTLRVDLSGLSDGVFLLKVINGNQLESFKIVKQN